MKFFLHISVSWTYTITLKNCDIEIKVTSYEIAFVSESVVSSCMLQFDRVPCELFVQTNLTY